MTFQRTTALQDRAPRFGRSVPQTQIVVGGYDPSLAPEAYEACPDVDFIVRGEGEQTFRELLRAIEGERRVRRRSPAVVSDARPASSTTPIGRSPGSPRIRSRLPNRSARVLGGYTLLGRPVDVVETSRGCTFDCSFCSIIEMRGRNFHTYPIERVLADIADARRHGARAIFLVDDNITLDVRRFEALCQAIIDSGFNDIEYFVQAMTSPLAQHGATLAPLMRRAGFRYVFLGIENVLDDDLAFLKARAKNARREHGRTVGNATIEAIEHLHRHGLFVVGGLIVGNPDDTRESIDANLAFARRYVDWPYIQHPTPYPGTPMTREFRERDLIVDEDVAHYDGTTAVVRSEHLSAARNRVSAVAGRAVDEGAAHAGRVRAQPRLRPAPRPRDAGAHVHRDDRSLGARPGRRARRVRALSGSAAACSREPDAGSVPGERIVVRAVRRSVGWCRAATVTAGSTRGLGRAP